MHQKKGTDMKLFFARPVMACILVTGVAMSAFATPAAAAQDEPVQVKSKSESKKKPAKTRPVQVATATFVPGGSQETVAQRSARLKRECKGAVNAGACEGYTR